MPTALFRAFAVVPAAGHSRRMGRPKLLLPWGQGTLIEQTLAAWKRTSVSAVVVVVRPDDDELASLCRLAGAEVVVPTESPPHMRHSVQHALDHLAQTQSPRDEDVWLLAPADMPNLSPAIVAELLVAHQPHVPAILAPMVKGRRGHPVLFPWPLARQVPKLEPDRGIDALCWQSESRSVSCDHLSLDVEAFLDVDTQDDYDRAQRRPPTTN